jgi:DNA-directed RNA polymerase subunit RPC12/RpoP
MDARRCAKPQPIRHSKATERPQVRSFAGSKWNKHALRVFHICRRTNLLVTVFEVCDTESSRCRQFLKVNEAPSLQGGGMSQWILTCSTCGKDFPHSSIHENLTFTKLVLLRKPEFPSEGLALDCPNCGKSATYQRYDLLYDFSAK